MNKNNYLLVFGVLIAALLFVGCAKLSTYLNGASTSLASTSLSAASALRAAGIRISGTNESGNWLITPHKISGKILSIVLPCSGQEDEGVCVFGSGRPDIAPANSTLYDFDLSSPTKLKTDTVSLKPGFKGGKAEQIILMFGYFDVEFDQGTTAKKLRFVYGDTNTYVRGDKLLYNASGESTGKYYWYNTATNAFVSESLTRPSSPCANAYVRDFSDPVRPQMHYYMLGALLKNCTDYDGHQGDYITLVRSVLEDNELSFTVDFNMGNAVIFSGVTSEADFQTLTDAQLIQKFDMKQNTARGWQDTALTCKISFEATPKFK